VQARFLGNCLGELDRFLHVLMDEVAPGLGAAPAPLQRNAANKLAALGPGVPDLGPTRLRLRALGRSRACLFHCRGVVSRADAPGLRWMTAGWPGPDAALRRYDLGEQLSPAAADMADIALFYDRLADQLTS
jgi:hypothetical protein